MTLFPMFMKLEGRNCLVVGAGSVGEPKIESLLTSGASVRVVAPRVSAAVAEWARGGSIVWQAREFELADLDGVFLVIAATSSREVNARIFHEARQRAILCNVVDDPEYCDFYYPAVVRRGDLQLAISTNGHSPALAQRIRRELEIQFGPEYAGWLAELGKIRQQLFASGMKPDERRRVLHELASREAFERAHSEVNDVEAVKIEAVKIEELSVGAKS
jgi:precorrin-2 dehydrogenase / sirohydrochlorin ferrochelatase